MIGRYSTNALIHEISKCDIRCSNCHKIRTSKQQNWHKGNKNAG